MEIEFIDRENNRNGSYYEQNSGSEEEKELCSKVEIYTYCAMLGTIVTAIAVNMFF